MDDILILLSVDKSQDDFGVWRETAMPRQVYCRTDSVTRAEFFEGGRNGLNPELRFTVFTGDYGGERDCIYRDKPYGIYRTYQVAGTDYMELYAERKGGTNGNGKNAD